MPGADRAGTSMKSQLIEKYIVHLDSIIKSYEVALRKVKIDGEAYLPDMVSHGLIPRIEDIVIKATGKDSPFSKRVVHILGEELGIHQQAPLLVGLVKELKKALKAGYLSDFQRVVAGEIFDNLLEMAQHLFNETYYLPATAVAGAVLEDSLRMLYGKNIALVKQANKEYSGDPSISKFNDALRLISIYPLPQWRLIQSWADIRNHAVHGKPMTELRPDLIKNMIDGIRSFLASYPA